MRAGRGALRVHAQGRGPPAGEAGLSRAEKPTSPGRAGVHRRLVHQRTPQEEWVGYCHSHCHPGRFRCLGRKREQQKPAHDGCRDRPEGVRIPRQVRIRLTVMACGKTLGKSASGGDSRSVAQFAGNGACGYCRPAAGSNTSIARPGGPNVWSWSRRTRRPRGKSAVGSDWVDAMGGHPDDARSRVARAAKEGGTPCPRGVLSNDSRGQCGVAL